MLPAICWGLVVWTHIPEHKILYGTITFFAICAVLIPLFVSMWYAIPEDEWRKYDDYPDAAKESKVEKGHNARPDEHRESAS